MAGSSEIMGMFRNNSSADYYLGQPRRINRDYYDLGKGPQLCDFYAGDHTSEFPGSKLITSTVTGQRETVVPIGNK